MQNKNQLPIKEAIYTSSEKNANSYSGFGFRTYHPSIDHSLLKDVGYHCVAEIEFDAERLNHNVKFPVAFVYEPVCTEQGIEKFVFRRTVFIGIEYGYFNEGVGGQRIGSNFITHFVFFDSPPPPEIFDVLMENNAFGNQVFQPLDYTCRPDNPELKKLLVGEPAMMSDNCFEFSETKDITRFYEQVDVSCGKMIIAALQYYFDAKLKPSEEFRHILVKAPHQTTNKLVWTIKRFLPEKFVNHLFFTTHYMEGNLPPYNSKIQLIFTNEYFRGTVFDGPHIFIDTATNESRNIDSNRLFDGILELTKAGKIEELRRLLFFLEETELASSADLDSIYQLFVISNLIDSGAILCPEDLFRSLQTSDIPEIWQALIAKYITPAEKNDYQDLIISQIVHSNLTENAVCALLMDLYPLSGNGKQIFCDYCVAHSDDDIPALQKLSGILENICLGSPKECFSALICNISNPNALLILSPIIHKYYRSKLEKSTNGACFEEFVHFITLITAEKADLLDLKNLFNDFAQTICEKPSARCKDSITALLDSGVKMAPDTQELFVSMLSLMNDTIPAAVNRTTLLLAWRLKKKNALETLFDQWLDSGLGKNELIAFIANANSLADMPQFIEHIVIAIWTSENKTIKQSREELVKAIILNVKWEKNEYRKFIADNRHPDLTAFIGKSSGFVNRLSHFLFGKKNSNIK